MLKTLQRKLLKLDQDHRISFFETNMRLLLRKLHWNEEASMAILIRHQRELAPCMGDGTWPGAIDPYGYDRIHKLVPPGVRNAPPDPDAAPAAGGANDDRKRRAIDALIDHHDQSVAARVAGISRTTLWRWLQQPSFLLALAEARQQAFWQAFGTLDRPSGEVVGVLTAIVKDATVSTRTRMRAGFSLVALGETALEQATIDAQLAGIEEACNTPAPLEPATPSVPHDSPAAFPENVPKRSTEETGTDSSVPPSTPAENRESRLWTQQSVPVSSPGEDPNN